MRVLRPACVPFRSLLVILTLITHNAHAPAAVTQKKDIKRQKARLEALKQEAERERMEVKLKARERVLREFERGQLGLGLGGTTLTSTSGAKKEIGRAHV